MEKFTIGLLLGAVGGALLAANSCKMRTLVKKGQEEVKQRLDEMMDEKLKEMQDGGSVFGGSSEKSDSEENAAEKSSEKLSEKSESAGQGRDEADKKERGK